MNNLKKILTPFEWQVLGAVTQIPAGETRSYQEVAEAVGRPKAARAVGQALRNNPFAPVIPCHRVIRRDGSLGGYQGKTSLKKKSLLLRIEKEVAPCLKPLWKDSFFFIHNQQD